MMSDEEETVGKFTVSRGWSSEDASNCPKYELFNGALLKEDPDAKDWMKRENDKIFTPPSLKL